MSATEAQDDSGPGSVRWIGVHDAAALREIAYRHILDAAGRAIERRGRFLIVLAGGNTPRDIYRMLRAADTDWSRWQVYFGDERCLPADDAERNSRMAADAWLDHVPIPQHQVHAIPPSSARVRRPSSTRKRCTASAISTWCCSASARTATPPACFPAATGASQRAHRMRWPCSMRRSHRRSACRSARRG